MAFVPRKIFISGGPRGFAFSARAMPLRKGDEFTSVSFWSQLDLAGLDAQCERLDALYRGIASRNL